MDFETDFFFKNWKRVCDVINDSFKGLNREGLKGVRFYQGPPYKASSARQIQGEPNHEFLTTEGINLSLIIFRGFT